MSEELTGKFIVVSRDSEVITSLLDTMKEAIKHVDEDFLNREYQAYEIHEVTERGDILQIYDLEGDKKK